MQIISTGLDGLLLLEPPVYKDSRGYFFESYNAKQFLINGLEYFFVQDNESYSHKGVIRGLHYQVGLMAQAKLVRVALGEVLDIALDLRKDSPTFGKHYSVILSSNNKKQLLIPRGFAHGFSVLSEEAVFLYKCDNYYSKAHEAGFNPLDTQLAIDWKVSPKMIQISDKDLAWPSFPHH